MMCVRSFIILHAFKILHSGHRRRDKDRKEISPTKKCLIRKYAPYNKAHAINIKEKVFGVIKCYSVKQTTKLSKSFYNISRYTSIKWNHQL
jgi:hypothetical protein